MGLYSANYLAELRTGRATVHRLMEIDFPSSGTKRWSSVEVGGVSSASRGYYEGRVKKWGKVPRAVADRRNALQAMVFSLVIDDTDQMFRTIIASGERIYGAAVRCYLTTSNLAFADWFLAFTGRLSDFVQGENFEWTLNCTGNDQPLLSELPRVFVTEADWPNSHKDALGQPVPHFYGLHDSTSSKAAGTSDGALPTLYVDTVGFRYLVSIGYTTPLRVYKNGALVAVAGYAVSHVTVNGRPYTLIDFVADQTTGVITVDAYGYETVGDGTGTYILSSVDILKHWLDHFVFNDSTGRSWTGVWPTVTSVCSVSRFASLNTRLSTAAGGGAYIGALYVGDKIVVQDVLNQWGADNECKLFWRNNGALAVGMDDPSPAGSTVYVSDPWLRYPQDYEDQRLALEFDSSDLLDSVIVQTSKVVALDRYMQQIEVFDPLPTIGKSETFSPTWGPAGE